MFGFDERYRAPAALDVRLWESATFSSAGVARTETVDVILESQEAVWGLLTVFERDVIVTRGDAEDPIRDVEPSTPSHISPAVATAS